MMDQADRAAARVLLAWLLRIAAACLLVLVVAMIAGVGVRLFLWLAFG